MRNSHIKAIAIATSCAALIALAVVLLPAAPSAPTADEQATASETAPSAEPAEAPAADDDAPESEPQAAAQSEADRPAYDGDALLATLADGASLDDLLAALSANPVLSQVTVAKQGDGYVKLALPEGLSVENAVDLVDTLDAVENAQPNYRYYLSGTAATGAATGTATSASTILGTAAANASYLVAQAAATANDPYYTGGKQWTLDSVNAPEAWSLVNANAAVTSPVTVAVIDAGFLVNHEDLKAHVVDYYNVASGSTTMGTDDAGHGTHVAGTVSAVTNNGVGVAAVANNTVGLMLLRASDARGNISSDTIIDAYTYLLKKAKTHNVRVVNMSLGGGSRVPVGSSYDTALYNAIAKAKSAGIVTVAAACNEDFGWPTPFYAYPSDFDNVVSVINLTKSTNADGVEREESSNYTKSLTSRIEKNISAPGTDVYSAYSSSTSSYKTMTGTSMASPLVAGVLGLMFTVNPNLTVDQAAAALYSSAKDLTASPASTGWDRFTGWGEVDAAAALRAVGAAAEPAAGVTSVASLSISAANATYTGKALTPAITVKNGSTVLQQGADYTVTYRDNTAVGKAAFTVRGIGNYCGIAIGTFTINQATLKSVALKAAKATYDGKAHKPAIKTAKIAAGAITSSDYTVTYFRSGSKTTNYKNVGTITVKVTGKNNCKGAVTKTFTINPKGTSITKLTPAARSLTVRWKKQATQTTGFQMQVATSKTFKSGVKTITKASKSAVTATASSLKAKKTYYVRVRSYKTVSGKRLYSTWSKVKSAKTK